ncbi:MAG: hypothetical protein INQ03_17735 [Candidatus Heimdallarchaeota archaeon]|nr:hypothetical protein [Candidatus Heimdallarchaeota archaeon]
MELSTSLFFILGVRLGYLNKLVDNATLSKRDSRIRLNVVELLTLLEDLSDLLDGIEALEDTNEEILDLMNYLNSKHKIAENENKEYTGRIVGGFKSKLNEANIHRKKISHEKAEEIKISVNLWIDRVKIISKTV